MSVRTAGTYERGGRFPSQLTQPREYRTRLNPFEADWPWITGQLERDAALQATTLFAILCDQHPGRYQATQLRTLQRQIATWRAQYGPGQEVIFPQHHLPGIDAQSDFTHMTSLAVTLGGVPFPHLLFHLVLSYSNVEAIQVCFSESFESLVEGIERCLWQLGGVPQRHRTDHLSAAIHPLDGDGRALAKDRYSALMRHYGMEPTTNTLGVAHENGDVEQSHYRFKEAVDQALRVRGSREFLDRQSYTRFLQTIVTKRNLTRHGRWVEEQAALRPLPAAQLALCREERVPVSRFSTIQVLRNTYSVPARLIGTTVLVRIRSETLEVYRGTAHLLTMPRCSAMVSTASTTATSSGRWCANLVPSPSTGIGRPVPVTELPSCLRCVVHQPPPGRRPGLRAAAAPGREYLRERGHGCPRLLLDQQVLPTFDAVRDLVREPVTARLPVLGPVVVDLGVSDRLLATTHA
jgi:Integrase core domain.